MQIGYDFRRGGVGVGHQECQTHGFRALRLWDQQQPRNTNLPQAVRWAPTLSKFLQFTNYNNQEDGHNTHVNL